MTKIYIFQEKKTLTRAFVDKDYACVNGELIKCTTTTYNKCYEKYFKVQIKKVITKNLENILKEMLLVIILRK